MDKIALATILIPFIGALLAACLPYRAARALALVVALAASAGSAALGLAYFNAGMPENCTFNLVSYNSAMFGGAGHTVEIFGVLIDRVSTLICFAVVFLGFLVVLYSTAYLTKGNREHPHEGTTRFYAIMLAFIGAMAGLTLSSTLFGQLLFFEITGGCSWALIGYYQTPKALRSGMKALLVTHLGALGLYVAAAWLYHETGSFALSGMAGLGDTAKIIIVGGVLFAAWGKSAQIPMHMWLPDAMEAPTPVSAYLHAASMVKVGVFIFARAVMAAGDVPAIVGQVGMVMAVITLIYGFIMYLPQTDMKRLLAYSTITQLSYIFFAISLAILCTDPVLRNTVLLFGAIAYIFNHAFAKSLFFLVAGALSYTCGTRTLTQLQGILSRLPLLGIGFCVAALAITGVPPLNGFFSKYPIFTTGFALGASHWFVMALTILVMIESVGSFAWFLYWFGKTVPGKPSEVVAQAQPVPSAMKLVLAILVFMSFSSSIMAVYWLNHGG